MHYDPVKLPGWRKLPVWLLCHQLRTALGEAGWRTRAKLIPGFPKSPMMVLSHPFSLAGHCNCRHRIQEDILEDTGFALQRSCSVGVTGEGAVQQWWTNTQGPLVLLCTTSPSSLAQIFSGNSVPTQPLRNLLASPWGQCWALGVAISLREGGRWNKEVLLARLGNAVCPSIASGRNTLHRAWRELGRAREETQPGRWVCPR